MNMSEGIIYKVLEHHEDLLRYARKLSGNEHDAEDVVQRAYEKIMQKTDLTADSPKGLGLTVVFRESMNIGRRKRISRIATNEIDENTYREPEPKEMPQEIADAVNFAVNALPDEYKTIFLDVSKGLKYNEIAAKQNIPIGTVMSRMYRARQQLQEALSFTVPWLSKAG
jgi:RNA polymerase sigma-70 factor (ECF subfamily)